MLLCLCTGTPSCTVLYCIGICLSIHISAGMPSIEWKWSEWIPLAELCALVAHTVGRSATETAQHCMATHPANQASRWHSLDITQERYTEHKKIKNKFKKSYVAMATPFICVSGQLSNAQIEYGHLRTGAWYLSVFVARLWSQHTTFFQDKNI